MPAGVSLAGCLLDGRGGRNGLGIDIGDGIRRRVFGLPGGFPYPWLRLWRGRQRSGLIDLLIDFRRGRDGGDKLDIHGFSLVLEAAWRRQSDQHRQNQGKGRCVEEADANHPNRELDLLGIDHGQRRAKS